MRADITIKDRPDPGIQALWIATVGVAAAFAIGLRLTGWIGAEDAAASRATFDITAYLPVWLVEALFAGLLWRSLWRGGVQAVGDRAQVDSAFVLLAWLLLHVLVVLAGGGILAHMDRPWSQLGAEIISPAHLMTFVAVMPSYIVVGGAAYLCAKTQLPEFAHAHRRLMLIVFVGPFMFVPAFDPQLLLHTLDPGGIAVLAAYWIVVIGWSASTLWMLARLGRFAMKKMPRESEA